MIIRDSTKAFEFIKAIQGNVLLVEAMRNKYVPLGLLKLYTYYMYYSNFTVLNLLHYAIGKYKFENTIYDTIFISAGEFSYYHKQIINVVSFYRREYPDAHIIVGGVYCIIDDGICQDLNNLGCIVIATNIYELDDMLTAIDYSLFSWNPWSFIFTSRGCKMSCAFCYVKDIEDKSYCTANWEQQIENSAPRNIMIHDNNILSYGREHFTDVTNALIRVGKPVMFDNGFDCRFWNKDAKANCIRLQDEGLLQYTSIRFAFDSMNQDGKIQRALEDVKKFHPIGNVLVYILVNFEADIDECLYRASEVAKIGAYPFIQYYTPLDWRDDPKLYKGPSYTPELHILSDYFNGKWYNEMEYEMYKIKREAEEIAK